MGIRYFGLLGGGADHYTKTEEACGGNGETCRCGNISSATLPFRVDFWDGLAPAHALWDNTTYDAFQYTARAVELVEQHDVAQPFFLYWAPHKVHSPPSNHDVWHSPLSLCKDGARHRDLRCVLHPAPSGAPARCN